MKFFSTIRGKVSVLLGAFFLLITISVGVTFWGLHAQADDAQIINLAGRQRMLTQKMTWLALAQPDNPELVASIELFEQTLQALSFGGATLDSDGNLVQLPPPPNSDLHAQLEEVSKSWEQFQSHLHPPDEAQLPTLAITIQDQLDDVVSAFESLAELKQQRLVSIQIAFLITATLLLGWGFITTRFKIIIPLVELGRNVSRIGKGDLGKPIPQMEDDELGELAQTFEIMRVELAASRRLLEDQVDQRTRELTAAFEFSQEIVAQRRLDELMNSAIEHVRLLLNAQSAALCILTPDGCELEMMASSGENGLSPGLRQSTNRGMALPVVGDGRTVVDQTVCADCRFLAANPSGMCLATPLRAADQTIGALCVVRTRTKNTGDRSTFGLDEQRALSLLANSAAIAITNARLAQAEREKAGEAAALAEREQLAAGLHDNLAQTLSYTALQLEQLKETLPDNSVPETISTLAQIEAANQAAYQQVRNALTGLLKPSPSSESFARKLVDNLADFETKSGLSVELEILDQETLRLPAETQTQILHIIGEALANIRQHAQAQKAWVRIECKDGCAHYTIEDDGAGFDPQAATNGDHFGLNIMRTRARKSGGDFMVVSTPGEGTRI